MVCCKRRLSFVLFCQCCITFFFGFELLQLLWLSGHHSAVQVNSISYTKELTSLQVTLFNVIDTKNTKVMVVVKMWVWKICLPTWPCDGQVWVLGPSNVLGNAVEDECDQWLTCPATATDVLESVLIYQTFAHSQLLSRQEQIDCLFPMKHWGLLPYSLWMCPSTPPTHPRWHASTWLRHEYLYGHRLILRVVRDREIMHVYMFVYIVMISTCRSACVEVTLAPPLVSRYIVKQRA